ncbi:glycosyltransferase [Pseudotabrizicola sp. 4114]|uniref:glycosyltransferase n=1 Tax=Pseudotabrizicola sp. 4114 TaxID=2817731 RepID=UPI00285976F4|nr:glycosyltransferase involved in cell wall biosynthesis [Pseudorhodobacter sp. 4114]
MDYPKISMVIGSFNRRKLLELCIEAVRAELNDQSYEIIVVDGGSTDGTVEWLVQQKDIITIIQHNRGEWGGKQIVRKPWAYFMNLAFKAASGQYICMLSDDSLIVPGAINNGVELFDEQLAKGVKLGGVAFYFRDYPVRKKYAIASNLGNLYVNHGLFLKAAMEEVGYCDESYHFYFSDTDLALKIRAAGYEIIPSKLSFVEHYFDATPEIRSSNNDERKLVDRQKLISKWSGIAYPKEKEEYYSRHVGRWLEHPDSPTIPLDTIQKLVAAENPDYFSFPRVSVITVVYEDPKGLARTIDSIKSQTYPFIEYVVIDGGSGEAVQQVLSDNSESIDILVSEKDNGIYDAMNKGISLFTGDFCLFMNAGDTFYEADTLKRLVANLDDVSDVFYGHREYIHGAGHSLAQIQKGQPIEKIVSGMPFCHQSILYKSDALKRNEFNTTYRYAADYNQFVKMYTAGAKFRLIDQVICKFFAGGSSESGIRPYLECLKIQFDYFGDGEHIKESKYMKGFIKNWPDFEKKFS